MKHLLLVREINRILGFDYRHLRLGEHRYAAGLAGQAMRQQACGSTGYYIWWTIRQAHLQAMRRLARRKRAAAAPEVL